MEERALDTISLMINRQKKLILVDHIIYAAVEDKRCILTLIHQETLTLFMTIRSLKDKLPADRFIQISRSHLVSLQHIRQMDDASVILSDGTALPYSRRQKTFIVNALHSHLTSQALATETISWKAKLATEFQCLDHCPIPFFVTETLPDEKSRSYNPIIRYANEAFAEHVRIALYLLLGQSLGEVLKGENDVLIPLINNIALVGGTANRPLRSLFSDITLHYAGYRPHYGFCASFLIPIPTGFEMSAPSGIHTESKKGL